MAEEECPLSVVNSEGNSERIEPRPQRLSSRLRRSQPRDFQLECDRWTLLALPRVRPVLDNRQRSNAGAESGHNNEEKQESASVTRAAAERRRQLVRPGRL